MKEKISQMLIDVADESVKEIENKEELEIYMGIVVAAWNISILPSTKRKTALSKYLRSKADRAPSAQHLEDLRLEMQSIIRRKIRLYPSVKIKIAKIEVIDKGDEFITRAYYYKDPKSKEILYA